MAKVRAEELRAFGQDDLQRRLEEARKELMNLRFRKATLQLDDVTQVRQAEKNVARILTVLRERELAGD